MWKHTETHRLPDETLRIYTLVAPPMTENEAMLDFASDFGHDKVGFECFEFLGRDALNEDGECAHYIEVTFPVENDSVNQQDTWV